MKTPNKLAGLALATALIIGNKATKPSVAEEFCPPPPADGKGLEGTMTGNKVVDKVARQKLVDALRQMKKNPDSIKFHSAMCYKVARDPDSIEYSCPTCGTQTTHQFWSEAGTMARKATSISRSLAKLPTKVIMDESSLCSKCGQGKAPELSFTTTCAECGIKFPWQVKDNVELDKIFWLFLPYPVDSIDNGPGKGPQSDSETVKEMVKFVSQKLFCPGCVKKLELQIQE